MTRRTALVAGPASLLLGAATAPAGASAPPAPAPQHACSGAFCVDFDLLTMDAQAPAQATTAAGQPTNLALRFTDTSAAVATDKTTWLAKVSAVLGTSSTKAIAFTDPAQRRWRVRRRLGRHGGRLRRGRRPATPLPVRPAPAADTSRQPRDPGPQIKPRRSGSQCQNGPRGRLDRQGQRVHPHVTLLVRSPRRSDHLFRRDRERGPHLHARRPGHPDACRSTPPATSP